MEPVTELSIELFRLWNSISSWGFRFEGYKMWCGFISLDQFRFKGRVIEGTQTLDLFSMAGGLFRIKSVLGRPGKDGLDREAMPTLLVTTKRRSQERKEGLEPSTSALARLCSTIKLFPPATVVAKHY